MDGDPRKQELINLRQALAAFAVQLDAFEAGLRCHKEPLPSQPSSLAFAKRVVAVMRCDDLE